MPDIRLVVKPHPAEGAQPYLPAGQGVDNVVLAPPSAGIGQLTAVASALVTANSTAAIEAMPLGVPTLVVALPNNLSPFVEAGAMAGAASPQAVRRPCEPCCMIVRCASEWRWRKRPSCADIASKPTARPQNGPPRPSFPWRGPERA